MVPLLVDLALTLSVVLGALGVVVFSLFVDGVL